MKVKVLGLQKSVGITAGEELVQVTFGIELDLTPEVRDRATQMGQPTPQWATRIGANIIVLFVPFSGPVPYRLGSSWDLTISEGGGISLEEES